MVNQVHSRNAEFCRVADYIPVFSTFTNLVNLIQKAVVSQKSEHKVKNDPFYTYIKHKSALRCIALIFFPGFGNLAFGIYDAVKNQRNNQQQLLNRQIRENHNPLIKELKNVHVTQKIAQLKEFLQRAMNENRNVKECYADITKFINELTKEQYINHVRELDDLFNSIDHSFDSFEGERGVINLEQAGPLGREIIHTESRFRENIGMFLSNGNVNTYFDHLVKDGIIQPEEKERLFGNYRTLMNSSEHFEQVIKGEKPFSIDEFKRYLLLLRLFTLELGTLKSIIEKNYSRYHHQMDQTQHFRMWEHFDNFLSQPFQRSLRWPMLLEELKKNHPDNTFIERLNDYFQLYANTTNAIMDKYK